MSFPPTLSLAFCFAERGKPRQPIFDASRRPVNRDAMAGYGGSHRFVEERGHVHR